MRKKLSLFLAVVMVVMGFQVNISANLSTNEENQYSHERLILEGLGIISEEINYNGDKILTRGDFSVMLARLMGYTGDAIAKGIFNDVEKEYYAADEIEFLYTQGIIKGYGDGSFRAGSNITYQEVIALLLRLMGIDKYVEHYKNSYFPEKNIKNDSELVTFDMATGYIYEAMNTKGYEYNSAKGGVEYSQSEKTILEKWRDISVVEGVVLTIGYKSVLYNGGKGIFLVDNLSLHTDEPYKFECVGKYSEVYYYNEYSDYEGEVVVAEAIEKQNDVTVIDGDDAYYKDGKIYYTENNKEKSISISPRTYLAKNYKPAYNTDIESLFNVNSGHIIVNKIKKNNIEVVMIEDYENYVVSGKSEYDQKIYTLNNFTINLENVDECIIRDTSGKVMNFSDINNEDVISVLTGDNYKTYVEMIVSRDIVNGTIESIKHEDLVYEFKIDNVDYTTIKKFNFSVLPNIGTDVSVYLNFLGKVVCVQISGSSAYKYGYLCTVKPDEDEENVFFATVFSEDDQMYKRVETGKKVRIDNKVYKTYDEAVEALKNGTGTTSIYQPIRFRRNDAGLLVEIDTEYRNTAANESRYSLTPIFKCYDSNRVVDTSLNGDKKGTLIYHRESNNFEGYFIRESNSKNFRVPAEYQNAEDFYTAKLVFGTAGYAVDAYTANPDKLSADFIIQYSSVGTVTETTRIGVIMDAKQAINKDDEVGIQVKIASRGNTGGVEYFLHENCPLKDVPTRAKYHIFENYEPKKGDAVVFSLNSQNEIVEISPYYIAEDNAWYIESFVTDTYEGTWSGTSNFARNERLTMGCVYDVYNNNVVVALTDDKTVDYDTEKRSYTLDSSVKIYLVGSKKLRELTVDEFDTYMRSGGGCNEIVIETYCNKPFMAIVYEG